MSDTIYDVLRDSHEKQRELCTRLTRTRGSNPQGRLETLTALRIELAAHAAAEERYLYAPILMDDMGLQSSRHALSEHHDIDELVEDLQALEASGDAWGEKAKDLAHKVRHHLKEEETKFFQISGKILTDAQKTTLAGKYRRDYQRMKKVLA
jgi:ElaB/YqjD/DUF883 family membrane-anchored ribosome-binding protein